MHNDLTSTLGRATLEAQYEICIHCKTYLPMKRRLHRLSPMELFLRGHPEYEFDTALEHNLCIHESPVREEMCFESWEHNERDLNTDLFVTSLVEGAD